MFTTSIAIQHGKGNKGKAKNTKGSQWKLDRLMDFLCFNVSGDHHYHVLRRAIAERTTRNTKRTAAMNDPTTAPLTFWQKSPNCWQIASQLVFGFPLCARYTIAAAAAPAAVVSVSATYRTRVLTQ